MMGDDFGAIPHLESGYFRELRVKLIKEETQELFDALGRENLIEIADGIVDSIVVLLGTAVTYGIDIRLVWDEIHKTNMAKQGGKKRSDGKFLKPGGWQPPRVAEILRAQGLKE